MKLRKELWFGFSLMAIIILALVVFTPWTSLSTGHLGLVMLALVVVTIMLGFPTAFTLMGMGVLFAWLAYRAQNVALADRQVLDLMVQRAYAVMANDVLIAVPLFVFMGYLVERAALVDKLFKALHLALSRVPGSLAVATILTCAVFATATGIIGAVVTLMGLLAFPAMLRAGYNVQVGAGAVTAGGCLGILIPPSVLLIVYGATAGVSVVQLYAGAFFPGLMLTALYVGYIMLLAKLRPNLMPPLPESERQVPLPGFARALSGVSRNPLAGLLAGLRSREASAAPKRTLAAQLLVSLLPALAVAVLLGFVYQAATAPAQQFDTAGLVESGGTADQQEEAARGPAEADAGGLTEPAAPAEGELAEPEASGGELSEPPAQGAGAEEPPAQGASASAESAREDEGPAAAGSADSPAGERRAVPTWYWIVLALFLGSLAALYTLWTWERLEIFKMLLGSFFPLALLILAVLGSIVLGFATPTEAAAVGALGGFVLACAYRLVTHLRSGEAGRPSRLGAFARATREMGSIVKDSSFLTAKTSAMVCWLFVGSSIFSAAFALLGGQSLVERWVLSLDLTPIQFMILAQFIIFILGWPLEWTEIIVIFMPIFIPLLGHFSIDPLFFGLLVALNLQTAFLSPPVAMAAFYLKGVAPPHVTLNQIFAGMLPFMGIQVVALALLYLFPQIGLWLPSVVYGR